MSPELDDKLVKKYSKIFADRHESMQKTAMCWGFECDDGWYWLIDQLCSNIQSYIDDNPHKKISQVVATQVKEKFGGLRFYYEGGDSLIGGMVWLAESMSEHICESCGSIEHIGHTTGWIRTVCKKCAIKENLMNRWKEEK